MIQLLGDFALVTPAGLLQLLASEGRQVRITATGPQSAEVLIADGLIAAASCGELTGAPAVYALAQWRGGQFAVTPLLSPPGTFIGPCDTLLLEAARRRDEADH